MIKIFILFIFSFLIHDYHITHTTIFYNKKSNSFEITIKVSVEDLERSLETKEFNKLRIGSQRESKIADNLIENYFNKNFFLFINNNQTDYEWVGKEIDDNLHDLYLYFEIENLTLESDIESLIIENTVFLENQENQINLARIEFEKKDYNITFTKDLRKKKVIFDK
mgnify:FL=1|tara:strand:+ start:6285 stop:6785 length:501 start_codon:yes stop_codon:yes gene_type:complete